MENFLFQWFIEKKKNHYPTISTVTNIHTQFYVQIREYLSTRILAAALMMIIITFNYIGYEEAYYFDDKKNEMVLLIHLTIFC